jgi:hypothetical protein
VLDDMAEDAYQMQHWRMNLRVAGEGTGEVLAGRVRPVPSEGCQKASFVRSVRARCGRIEEGAGHSPSGERAGARGRFESWRYARLMEQCGRGRYGRGWRGGRGWAGDAERGGARLGGRRLYVYGLSDGSAKSAGDAEQNLAKHIVNSRCVVRSLEAA